MLFGFKLPMCGFMFALISALLVQSASAMTFVGFIFLDGAYLPGPYQIDASENVLFINELPVHSDDFDLSDFEMECELACDDDNTEYQTGFELFCDWLRCSLHGDVLILYHGEKPASLLQRDLGYDVLRSITGTPGVFEKGLLAARSKGKYSTNDLELATKLVRNHNSSPAEIQQVSKRVDKITEVFDDIETQTQANVLVQRFGYPLTIFAMIVVVFAFGHLMSHQPKIVSSGQESSEHARGVVFKSLIIVALLSAIDLLWTLAAFYSGVMREMNPVGSQFMSDPIALTVFKGVVTSVAIGLLYFLHQRPIAQVASWWSCLVLTLLTSRWLIFNSMFL